MFVCLLAYFFIYFSLFVCLFFFLDVAFKGLSGTFFRMIITRLECILMMYPTANVFMMFIFCLIEPGSEIASSWSPMQLKI